MLFYCKPIVFILVVLGMVFILQEKNAQCQEASYRTYSTNYKYSNQQDITGWPELKRTNPILYNLLMFFNPPF